MSDENHAVDGATPAAPAIPAPAANAQETPATPASAEQGQNDDGSNHEQPRDEKGRFVQERINDLTRKWRSTERALAEREQRIRELESRAAVPQAQASEAEPKLEDFADFNEWSRALVAHATRVAEQRVEARVSQQQQQTTQQKLAEQYGAREQAYAQAHPDYIEAAQGLGQVVEFSPAVVEVLASSDHGPAVVHHLGKHLDEAVRIANLPDHLAAVELARLEVRLSAPPKAPPVSAAPSPVPVLGGGSQPPAKDPASMSDAEWFAANSRKRNR